MPHPLIHRRQPSKRSCGQTCVAILAGVQPSEVIAKLHARGTSAKDVQKVAALFGVTIATPPTRFEGLPVNALMLFRVIWGERRHRTHWVVVDTRGFAMCVYDPSWPGPMAYAVWTKALRLDGGRVMTYYYVTPAA